MSLNLKSLMKKPQRSQFQTPFKTPSPSSSLTSTSSSFKIPPLTLSNGTRKRSSKSLSPADSLVLPPQKVQHKDVDVEAHTEKEKEEVLPPSSLVTPVTKAGESPSWSGNTTHVSDTPSWGPSPSQPVSALETSPLPEEKQEEKKEVLPYIYQGGANFEMDLTDLDKEYPLNPEPQPEPEEDYGNIDLEDFFEDGEEGFQPTSQQELVTPTEQLRVSLAINYFLIINH